MFASIEPDLGDCPGGRGQVKLGQEVDPGDVAAAINGLRAIYDFVITELEPP